jgi:hypothetical protein
MAALAADLGVMQALMREEELRPLIEALTSRVAEVIDLTTVMVADLQESVGDLGSQRHRRAYVRAAFALVEGVMSGLKGILVDAVPAFGVTLERAEQALLAEEADSLRDDGSGRVAPLFLRAADNLRFTFALGEKVFGEPVPVPYRDRGWAGFKESVKVRNRLVHPKRPSDLTVSDEEMAALNDATEWFKQWSVRFLLASKEASSSCRRSMVTELHNNKLQRTKHGQNGASPLNLVFDGSLRLRRRPAN